LGHTHLAQFLKNQAAEHSMAEPKVIGVPEHIVAAVAEGQQAAAAREEVRAANIHAKQEQRFWEWSWLWLLGNFSSFSIPLAIWHSQAPGSRQPLQQKHPRKQEQQQGTQSNACLTEQLQQQTCPALEGTIADSDSKLDHAGACRALAQDVAGRSWDGSGSQGTKLVPGVWTFRLLAVLSQVGLHADCRPFLKIQKQVTLVGFAVKDP
jgi:hypothetical protein